MFSLILYSFVMHQTILVFTTQEDQIKCYKLELFR